MRKLMLAGLALAAVAAAPPVPQALRLRAVLSGPAQCLALSPDGKLLAVGSTVYDQPPRRRWAQIQLWDVTTGKSRATWKGPTTARLEALSFSPDGKTIVSISENFERTFWNLATGKVERTFPGSRRSLGSAHQLSFSADGKQVGACTPQWSFVWDAVSGKELLSRERMIEGWGSTFSHDLRLVASPNHQDVDLWDVRSGKLVRSFLDHRGRVHAVSFSRDDRLLAVAATRRTEDNEHLSEVRVWDVARGRRKQAIPLGKLFCYSVALSPAGDLLAVSGTLYLLGPAEVRLFAVSSGAELARVRLPPAVRWARRLAFSSDGSILVTGDTEQSVQLWRVQKPGTAGARGVAK